MPAPPQAKPGVPLLRPLPAAPTAKAGCYENTPNGWREVPCATDDFIKKNFPRPDGQLTAQTSATPSLVYGQVQVTISQVASEQNVLPPSSSNPNPTITPNQ
jgi:hypothetical protein